MQCFGSGYFCPDRTFFHESGSGLPKSRIGQKSGNFRTWIQGSIFYILPPPLPSPPSLPGGGGGGGVEIWPKGLRGQENENLWTQFVQKLEKMIKNVFILFFTLLQIYVRGKKYDLRKGGGNMIFSVIYRPLFVSMKKIPKNCRYRYKWNKIYIIFSTLDTILFGQVPSKPHERISFRSH